MNGSTGRWVGINVAKSKLDVALLDERGRAVVHGGHESLLITSIPGVGKTAAAARSDLDLRRVEELLNNRPPKIFDFQSPAEVFAELKPADIADVALQV